MVAHCTVPHGVQVIRPVVSTRSSMVAEPTHAASAMAVQVVFAFFRKKLDGAAAPVAGFERVTDGPVTQLAVKRAGFATDLSR